ncbi:MAG: hypothetical protein FJW31_17275 [Acidobacteria bacterium]|nr:hypothetical protein [Acidobacteriota bacterium]
MFNAVKAEYADLNSRMLDNPIPQIDLELGFDAQAELVFPVVATLQGDELCLSVGGGFFGEWFPCSDPGVVERFRSCLLSVLSGSIRLVESAQEGQVFKAWLEECSSGFWRPTATWSKLRWPSLRKPAVRVQRNRPSSLGSGPELDRALVADLRDDAGDAQVFVDACAAIHQEANKTDLPWLKSLLQDNCALVREAVAAPIANLEGLPALRELLVAYQRGLDENHDHDGFSAVLIDMVSGDSGEAKRHLEILAADSDERVQENAR